MVAFKRPLHATHHCRHYSFERSAKWEDSGPRCAIGVDLSKPGACGMCMPERRGECMRREEYTEAERLAWSTARDEHQARLFSALAAIPHPIPMRTGGKMICPNCGGDLRYARWRG